MRSKEVSRRAIRSDVLPSAATAVGTRSPAETPEDFLRLALEARDPQTRERHARRGLACDERELAPDTQFLLLRQIYLAEADCDRWADAAKIAVQMAELGVFRDLAHHDEGRAHAALGDLDRAIACQRVAARRSPPARRSFHGWCLGTLQHFDGDVDGALKTLRRAERWAHRDRALIRAHAAYVRLDSGIAAPGLDEIIDSLARSPAREGYGQFLLGIIAYQVGDRRRAAVYLRAFLRRNAAIDPAKIATIREELHRARKALADIESD